MLSRRHALASAVSAALATSLPAQAQTAYPDRPVKILVGYAPGGGVDIVALLLAEKMRLALGQAVLVENRPGASAMIAAQAVTQAPADGYTLLLAAAGEIAANPALFKQRMSYAPQRDLAPISLLATVPNVLVVAPSAQIRNPTELVQRAKQRRDLSYASSGISNPQHLAGELLNRMAGTGILHVPYREAAPALTDVAAGRVTMNFSSLGPTFPLIQDGKLLAVGVTSAQRMPQLPDVPALAEGSGLAGYELLNWFGLFAPAKMPQTIITRLAEVVRAVLADAELASKLTDQGALPQAMAPDAFRSFVAAETIKFTKIIEDGGITAE